MPRIGILTLTVLSQIITGSECHMDSPSRESSRNVQYSGDHYPRSLTSDSSSNESLGSTREMFQTLFRDVNTILNSFTTSFLAPTRRKSKRSPPAQTSQQMDSRMLKQLWDVYNIQKLQHQGAEDRYFLFPNFDSWASTFTQYFWRDMAFNVFKIVGLSALYYLAPGVLTWYTQTFGSTV